MKTIRFRYEYARNAQHAAYHEAEVNIVDNSNVEQLGIAEQARAYKAAYAAEVAVQNAMRGSAKTPQIVELDEVRDRTFRGFCDAVDSACNHFDEAKRNAANELRFDLRSRGNLAVETIDEQSADTTKLIAALRAAPLAAHVALLGLGDWVSKLEADNNAVKALVQTRDDEAASRPAVQLRIKRKDTDKAFRTLLNHLDARATIGSTPELEALIAAMNAVSERYRNNLAMKGHNAPEAEASENGK